MVNRVILIGNLGRDPELRRLESGAAVAKFSIATNENYKDRSGEWQQQTEWHEIVAWRQLAERAESSLKKGMQIYLEGKLTHRSWQDQDGNNRKTTEVVANYFRIVGGRREGGQTNSNSGYFPSANDEPTTGNNTSQVSDSAPVSDAIDDDLPF